MRKNAFLYFLDIILGIVTLILAGVTLLGLIGGQVSPVENELMALLSFGLPGLLIANVVALLFWMLRLRFWVIVPMGTLACCWNYIGTLYQLDTRAEGYEQEAGLTVVSYNVEGFPNNQDGDKVKQVYDLLEQQEADIVCFQEFANRSVDKKTRALDYFKQRYPYKSEGVGGQVILSRYPIQQSQVIKFEYGLDTNSAQYADVVVNKQTYRIYNVHFLTTKVNQLKQMTTDITDKKKRARIVIGGWRDQQRYRSSQVDELHNQIALSDNRNPVLLCGDFNDTPYTYTYENIANILQDGFKTAGHGFMSTYNGAKKLLRIDYIFHSQEITGLDYYTVRSNFSDHNPVFFRIKL